MPVETKVKNPGDWTALPKDPTTGRPSADNYAQWQQDEAKYRADKDANVSRAYDGSPLTINPDNYQVASQGDYVDLAHKLDEARGRQGVQIDNRAADASLAQALGSRMRQQQASAMYAGTALGMTPSAAQEQMRMALDAQTAAANRNAALAGGARAIGASSGAYGQSIGQGAAGRQQETQQAYSGLGHALLGMRGGDIQALQQSQAQSYAQAQLDAAQAARNDAMARAYLGQSNNLSIEQLGADQAYEAQKSANQLGVTDQMERQRQIDAEQQARVAGAALGAASGGLATMVRRG